jgi:lysyl endopeptidase
MQKTTFLNIVIFFFLGIYALQAQISSGGSPISSDPLIASFLTSAPGVEILKSPDWQKVSREDIEGPGTRFSVPIEVNYDLESSGQWTDLPNGDRIWRLHVKSPGAMATAVFYDDFFIPQGAKLFMYSPDKSQKKGAYTWRNNRDTRRFWTGLIHGDEAIIEYYEPLAVKGLGSLHIFRVDHVYHKENFGQQKSLTNQDFGFGASWDCHENANCPEGDGFRDQQRGICRIILVVEEGMGYCTGNLMNNSNRDATPYILTAYHCQDGYTPLWDMYRFDFEYESEGCANPDTEPQYKSILGAELRAGRQQSDFTLLELIPAIPANYNLYFIGWHVSQFAPANSTVFHHPVGDIKKVSWSTISAGIENNAIQWDNGVLTPPYYHYRVLFSGGSTFQVGSSGAGLIDQHGLIVGQLNGGLATCHPDTLSKGYFGHFTYAWQNGQTPETRLKDWLEPMEVEADSIHGMEQPGGEAYTISGQILDQNGQGIRFAKVYIDNPTYGLLQFVTDENGQFEATEMPGQEEYTIAVVKDTNYVNGVTTADLIKVRKHILGVEYFDSPYKIISGDANLSNSVSTADIIRIQKRILAIQEGFGEGGAPSWRFVPAGYTFPDPEDPFDPPFPQSGTLMLENDFLNVNFIGIKIGDANLSADPQE